MVRNLDVRQLAVGYEVREISEKDIDALYELCMGNPTFYRYCPPWVTKESIRNDMLALPPKKEKEDKFYIGYFQRGRVIAIMDLILRFPDDDTALIGFFMMNRDDQGKGIGSKIISDCARYLKKIGYRAIRLGFAKGNCQSEAFWHKNGFVKTGDESVHEGYTAVMMQRQL